MPQARNAGIQLNYSVEGSGPIVIAISGFMSTVASSQFRLVTELTRRFQLVYGDHRGAGESDVPEGPYSIDQIADDWIAIMDAIGAAKAPVLGNSMGSLIALSIALRHPERVSRLVLSVPISHPDAHFQALVGHWQRTFEAVDAKEFAIQTLLWTLTPGGFNKLGPGLLKLLDQDPPQMDPAGFNGQAAAVTSYDPRPDLGRIDVPTLIVAGAEDRVCPPHHARELASLIPDSELKFVEHAGHLPQTENPAAYAAAVVPFLSGKDL